MRVGIVISPEHSMKAILERIDGVIRRRSQDSLSFFASSGLMPRRTYCSLDMSRMKGSPLLLMDMEEADASQVRFDGYVFELLLSEIADELGEDGL